MKRGNKGFTLTELLVVLAVIVLLAAILAPVFIAAKAAAKRAVCVSHLHQAWLAMDLYCNDYDDRYTPVNYEPGQPPDPTNDRTWVQLLLPYAKSFDIFRDPADTSPRPTPAGFFDEDLSPYDTYAHYYQASLRSDIGFNYIYLSPVFEIDAATNLWVSEPLQTTEVVDPANTLMFIDSLWGRDSSGNPTGGGNWLVTPPCRYEAGTHEDTFLTSPPEQIFAVSEGWSANSSSPAIYGHAWPWHSGNFNVTRTDGSIKSVSPGALVQGCDAQPQWTGEIVDPRAYMWSSHY